MQFIISPSLSLSDLSIPVLPSLVTSRLELRHWQKQRLFSQGKRFTEVLIALVYYAINFPALSVHATLHHRCAAHDSFDVKSLVPALHAFISCLPPSTYPSVFPPPGLITDWWSLAAFYPRGPFMLVKPSCHLLQSGRIQVGLDCGWWVRGGRRLPSGLYKSRQILNHFSLSVL